MDIKISQLPLANKMASSDYGVCVTEGSTRKITQKNLMGLIDRDMEIIEFNNRLEPLGIGVTETMFGSIKIEQAVVELDDLLNLSAIFTSKRALDNPTQNYVIRAYYSPNKNLGGQSVVLGECNTSAKFATFKRSIWVNANPGFNLNVMSNSIFLINDDTATSMPYDITSINVLNPSGNWYVHFTIQFGSTATTDYSTFTKHLVELKKV